MIFRVRAIPSCPRYFVSETGRIWGPRNELRLWPGAGSAYLRFAPSAKSVHRIVKVHHAVAEAFLGPKPPGAYVCHRNDDASDNRVENLYYGDAHTNNLDAFRNGGRAAKLSWKEVDAIREQCASGGVTHRGLARKYGVSHQAIGKIVHNKTWMAQT